ncbi:MAG: SUMF1/EgtB/PvdO family nonheme iron enzyme [Deltaproteobacteria bacterium]|nr:SUMF1/EgtB/PvdO family nonheme iron enzyme [Deltaproteobacteria bacterium]
MATLAPGTKLTDNLTLVRVLGEGGMGTVWLAEHRALGSEVAVKVMNAELARRDPTLLERFAAEARAAAKVRHPHIVQVLDHGTTAGGVAWLSMELLDGRSLRDVLGAGRRVAPAYAREVVAQVASALAKAHELRVIHRDLKPENLFVTTVSGKPFVKVLDFGIAKLTEESSGKTATSAVFGTPAYMSPEQLRSTKNVDAQADQWALAVVAYELLTGQLPFEGETASAIVIAVASGEYAAPSRVASELGPAVDAFFERAFARSASGRFASAEELAMAFASALEGPASSSALRTEYGAPAQHPRPDGGAGRGAAEALPARHATELASAPHIPAAPETTPARSKRSRSVALALSLVVSAPLVLGALALSSSKSPSGGGSASASASTASATAPPSASAASPAAPACPAGMALVPGGTFRMGSDAGEPNEKPVHEVKVEAFCLDLTEVTVADYAACAKAGPCTPAGDRIVADPTWNLEAEDIELYSSLCQARSRGREQHPVNCVDWAQASAFCGASRKRLPTEEEWEYAARGGAENRQHPWGTAAPDATRLNACGAECVSFGARHGQEWDAMYPASDGHEATAPVGSFRAGAGRWGHLDLAGNVSEWTSSGYSSAYQAPREGTTRVKRGVSWSYGTAAGARASLRNPELPTVRSASLGFRCAGKPLP